MNTAEIKIDVSRKLNSLKRKRLEEVYSMLINFLNNKDEINAWQLAFPKK